ncbi:DNA-binding SARP family transcriptional activator [Actinokineospora auranticolor]|uniref:DNA-binding SARP family transcriptional activator n=1 Tax=Actinokineospora auranticolor TaxID=155976 RepID=A0A2S6GDL5_9PSEU|nr:DNA-binding SARP family transcriptional activator [Actinokineospora auranticolor]
MFGVLGETAIRIDGVFQTRGKPRERAVLAVLLAHPMEALSLDRVLEYAWPSTSARPTNVADTVYGHVSRFRKQVEAALDGVRVVRGKSTVRLDVGREHVDAFQLMDLVDHARRCLTGGQATKARELLGAAVPLLRRGTPLADVDSQWARRWRAQASALEPARVYAMLVSAMLALDECDDALAVIEDVQRTFPGDERFIDGRLAALVRVGRAAEAEDYHREIRQVLAADGDREGVARLDEKWKALRVNAHAAHSEAPGTAPAKPRQWQLPQDIPGFVGRAVELSALDTALSEQEGRALRVVTVDGMGGVGKSSLAVHWAWTLRKRFTHAFYVDLCGQARDEEGVVNELLAKLDWTALEALPLVARRQRLGELLADKTVLLVLDNVSAALQLDELFSLFTAGTVVLVGRQRLKGLTRFGAVRVNLPTMTAADARRLLAGIIGARAEREADACAELVRRSGGLPLAIVLMGDGVAARPGVSVAEFTRTLGDRYGTEPDLNATFLGSYRELAEPERRLFRLISRAPGWEVSLAAAIAIDDRGPGRTRASLDVLVDNSLVGQPDDLGHYRLHALVRDFGKHRAGRDESPADLRAADQRVLEHLLVSAVAAHTLYQPEQSAPPPLLTPGRDNPPVDLADAAEAGRWFARERETLVAAVGYAVDRGFHQQCWRLAQSLQSYLDSVGRHEQTRVVLLHAVRSTQELGDEDGLASTLHDLGTVLTSMGRFEAARRAFRESMRLSRLFGIEPGTRRTLHQLARLEIQTGDYPRAAELYQECLASALAARDQEMVTWSRYGLGDTRLEQGDLAAAADHLRAAQHDAERTGNRPVRACAILGLARIHLAQGRLSDAHELAATARNLAYEQAHLPLTARCHTVIARIHYRTGEYERARDLCRTAVDLLRGAGDVCYLAVAAELLGDTELALGDRAAAVANYEWARQLCTQLGVAPALDRLREKLGESR